MRKVKTAIHLKKVKNSETMFSTLSRPIDKFLNEIRSVINKLPISAFNRVSTKSFGLAKQSDCNNIKQCAKSTALFQINLLL